MCLAIMDYAVCRKKVLMENPLNVLGGNLGDFREFCKGVRPSETQKIGVSDGLFSRNLFGIILGSLGIIIVGLVAKKPHCSGALC